MVKCKLKYCVLIITIFLFCNYSIAFCQSKGKGTTNSHVFFYSSDAKKNSLKRVALTFDDGPDDNYTSQILDILKKHNLKATFFLVGSRIKAHPDVVKRIVKEGHIIGNHTWDHQNFLKLSDKDILTEVSKTDEELYKIAGYHSTLLRPPFSFNNAIEVLTSVTEYPKFLKIIAQSIFASTAFWGSNLSGIFVNSPFFNVYAK